MSFERIMGVEVVDDKMYQKYRENMTPILYTFGGNLGFDFKIDEVKVKNNGSHKQCIYYRVS